MDSFITGIGGIFVKSPDPDALKQWYQKMFGTEMDQYGHTFRFRDWKQPDEIGHTQWGFFPKDSSYFGESGQQFMFNFRVRDLDELLSHLAENGVTQIGETESFEYGRFAWVEDADGHRIELWEPIDEPFLPKDE